MNKILALAISLGLISFILTYIIRKLANRYSIIDIPNERSSHTFPTPRGGGLAIVITWYIGISVLFYFKLIENNLYFALLCGVLLAIISLIDDVVNLKPIIRLVAQVITAIGAFIFLKGIDTISIIGLEIDNWYILYPLSIIGIVWFINLFNFLDGIDAYASTEAICIAIGLYIFTGNIVAIVLIVSVLGFLFWNWPKAKIFMGDVGSTQLGFILIVLGIYFHNNSQFGVFEWLILTSPFWFDATFTLFRRWRNKEKLSQAHKKHAYQRLVQSGFSHQKVVLYLIGVNIVLLGLVYSAFSFSKFVILFFFVTILIMYGITKWVDKRKEF